MQSSDNNFHTPLPDLVARFTLKKGLFRKELVEARLFDLNQFGCVLKTDKVFEPGDTLGLDLELNMPFENLQAQGLTGLVTERRKYCSNFFYSIDFVELDSNGSSSLAEKLRRIREVLSKKQSLKSRRSPGSMSGFR